MFRSRRLKEFDIMARNISKSTTRLTEANNSIASEIAEIRRLPVLIHQAREVLSSEFRPVFLIHDITDPQWRVLRILLNQPGIDTTNLAARSQLLGPSLSRIIRDLTERGLMRRQSDPADARRSFHFLTPTGEALIAEVSPYFTPIYERLRDKLGAERVKTLNDALEALLGALDRTTDPAAG